MNEALKAAIDKEKKRFTFNQLAEAREQLTEQYRDPTRHGKAKQFMATSAQRVAYLLTRMPATYAVVVRVLHEVKKRIPDLVINSMLDLGSGPGTAMWAAGEVFDELGKFTLVEQDSELMALGQRLASETFLRKAKWQQGNMVNQPLERHDLVVISYALGELSREDQVQVVAKAWEAAAKVIVIIEPGTMPGFGCIRPARQQLIELGSHLVVPCPHMNACPMPADDWCHFAERIERSSDHRKLKEGALGYEDEKFSYLVGAKFPVELPPNRILRHPQKHSGHINFLLCTPEGLQKRTVAKSDGELYKVARKLEWGEVLEKGTEATEGT